MEGEGEGLGELPTGGNKHTSSIGGASFNFINSIIGSGIIGTSQLLLQLLLLDWYYGCVV